MALRKHAHTHIHSLLAWLSFLRGPPKSIEVPTTPADVAPSCCERARPPDQPSGNDRTRPAGLAGVHASDRAPQAARQ
eukprot:87020-Alexandrium_andersonii.AAC.1